MGKGDKRTRRGKITAGTYGVSRPHKEKNTEEAKPAEKKATKAKAKPKAKKKAEK